MTRRRDGRAALLAPLLVVALGLAALLVAATGWQRSIEDQERTRRDLGVEAITEAMRTQLSSVVNLAARSARYYSPMNPQPGTPFDWESELSAAQASAPSTVALGYLQDVAPADRDDFIQRAQREISPTFTITGPADGDGVLHVVSRGAPAALLGSQLAGPEAATLVEQASAASLATIALAPRNTLGVTGSRSSAERPLVVLAPDRGANGSVDRGFGMAVLLGSALATDVQRNTLNPFGVIVSARTRTDAALPVGDATLPAGTKVGETSTRTFQVPGLDATFTLQITAPYDEARRLNPGPLGLVIGGSLAAVLLGALVWALGRSRSRALALVRHTYGDLVASEQRLQALVRHAADGVAVIDAEGRFSFVSPSVETMLGMPARQLLGRAAVDQVDIEGAQQLMDTFGAMPPDHTASVEVPFRRADGGRRQLLLTVTNLAHDPSVRGFVVNVHDVTDQRAYEQLLDERASHDPLTGLANRSRLNAVYDAAVDRVRDHDRPLAVLFVDLDRFKQVNDDYGHEAGDEVLQQVADRIRHAVRAGDTAVRVGGDEFVVVCPGASNEDAQSLAQRLADTIAAPYLVGRQTIEIGASVGVAVGDGRTDLVVLLREADRAMYDVKVAGRVREDDGQPGRA